MNSLVTLIDDIEFFSISHKQIERFKFEYEEQLPNFATSGTSFPLLFVAPINLTQNGPLNVHTLRVYVLNRLDRDRSNVLDSTNDTSLIITDLSKWWRQDNLKTDILLINEPFAIPLNNSQLDYLQGYYADFEFEIPTYSRCDIPIGDMSPNPPTDCADGIINIYQNDGLQLIKSVNVPSGVNVNTNIDDSIINISDGQINLKATDDITINIEDSNGDTVNSTLNGNTVIINDLPSPKELEILVPYYSGDTTTTFTIVTGSDGTITTVDTTGLSNVTYELNGGSVTLPFNLVVGDVLTIEFDVASTDGVIKLEGNYA